MKTGIVTILFLGALGFLALLTLVWSGLTDRPGKADVALVLGNTVYPDGTPSPRLKARLDTAIALYAQGFFPRILVSGGTGREGFPEGTAMKNYLLKNAVPESAIIVDNDGVDTRASATKTALFLKEKNLKSVFVITQFFHVPRSRLALAQLGIDPVYSAHASYFEFRDLYSTLREVPAYLKYLLKGPGPAPAPIPSESPN